MVRSSFEQTSFRFGEWSPTSQGQSDREDFAGGMNRCLNYYPLDEGPCTRRSGTRFSATVDALQGGTDAAVKLIPFITDEGASVLTVLLPGVIQFFKTGVFFSLAADTSDVESISSATPAVVTTKAVHGYTTGDQVRFVFDRGNGTSGAITVVNALFNIIVLTTTTFSISYVGARSGPVDGSTICWHGGQVSKIHELTSPWTVEDVETVKYSQDANYLYLFHPNFETRLVDEALALSTIVFEDGPFLDINLTATTLTPSGTTGSVTITASAATGVNGGQGFLVTDIGRQIRMFDSAGNWTWLKITAHASTTSVTALISGGDLADTVAVTDWHLGLYSDTTGWPVHGVRHEGRLWLCSDAQTGRVDGSEIIENQLTKNIFSFATTAPDGSVADSSAVAAIFDSDQRNRLNWLAVDDTGLLGGADEGLWIVQASSLDDPITPTSIQVRRKTRYGCADTQSASVNRSTVFVEALERQLVEIRRYDSGYDGKNASRTGDHLITEGLAEIRYANSPVPIIWGRTKTNRLVGVSIRRDIDGEQTGWHDQDLTYWLDPTQVAPEGKVLAICTLPKSDSDESLEETLWVCVERNGFYCIEWMSHLFDASRIETEGVFADSAVTYSSEDFSQTWNWVDPSNNELTFYGLWHLEGNTVDVVYRGVDLGTAVVTDGKVRIAVPEELLLCEDEVNSDPDRTIVRLSGSTNDVNTSFIARTTTTEIGGNLTYSNNGGQYLEGEDGKYYYVSLDGPTQGMGQLFDKDVGGVAAITLTQAQFEADMLAAGMNPNGNVGVTQYNCALGAFLIVPGTAYVIYVGYSGWGAKGVFFTAGYYRVDSTGSLVLVGATQDRAGAVLPSTSMSDTINIQAVSRYGEQTDADKIIVTYKGTVSASPHVMWLPSITEMQGVFTVGPETGTAWMDRITDLTDWGIWFYDSDVNFERSSGFYRNRAAFLPTVENGSWENWLISYVGNVETQVALLPPGSKPNAYIQAQALLYPNGFMTGVRVVFNPATEQLEVAAPIIFNCRFRDTSGNAVIPFDDAGLNKDGTTGVLADDYQVPSVYPTNRADASAPWLAIMPHVYLDETPDHDPVGTYLGLRIFEWSPSAGTAIEQSNDESATFDPTDLGVSRFTHNPPAVFPWYKDGVIDVLYLFDTSSSLNGFITADFSTFAGTPIATEYRTRGFEAYVGLNYASRGQILRPQLGGSNGPMLGKTRRIDQFAIHAHRTGFIQFGIDFNTMDIKYLVDPGDDPTDECGRRPLFSGIYQGTLRSNYNFDNMIAWEQPRPAPGTMLSVGGFMSTSDR